MKLGTKLFGEIDIPESKIIAFDGGLPGFTHCTRFFLIEQEGENAKDPLDKGLIMWLQSIDEPDIAFILMDVFLVKPDYDPLLDVEEIKSLGEFSEEDLLVYNICVMRGDLKDLTVNLKAPIIINATTQKGKQVIATNDDLNIRYAIFAETNASLETAKG